MRNVIFRGLVADEPNEWVYGYYDGKQETIHQIEEHDKSHHCGVGYFHVRPETTGQYTGLKDRYGNKIFEGDILREYSNEIEDWVVSYEYGKFIGTFDDVEEDLYELSDLEVIGNIYESKVGE